MARTNFVEHLCGGLFIKPALRYPTAEVFLQPRRITDSHSCPHLALARRFLKAARRIAHPAPGGLPQLYTVFLEANHPGVSGLRHAAIFAIPTYRAESRFLVIKPPRLTLPAMGRGIARRLQLDPEAPARGCVVSRQA
jgi:hypothetical protein